MGVDEVSRVLFWVFEMTLLLMLIEGKTLARSGIKRYFLNYSFHISKDISLKKTMIKKSSISHQERVI